jgi:hypothetical protein
MIELRPLNGRPLMVDAFSRNEETSHLLISV